MKPRPTLALVNAALNGEHGNTAALVDRSRRFLSRHANVNVVTLAPRNGLPLSFQNVRPTLAKADGLLFATGTHWDAWSSVLQKFLEEATETEATKLWLGKPAAVIVSEHSVGGKGVLSRLQGVLNTFGCAIPPMSGLVISRAALLAAQHDADAAKDFWCLDDLKIICHNLLEATRGSTRWKTWPVDRKDFGTRWIA